MKMYPICLWPIKLNRCLTMFNAVTTYTVIHVPEPWMSLENCLVRKKQGTGCSSSWGGVKTWRSKVGTSQSERKEVSLMSFGSFHLSATNNNFFACMNSIRKADRKKRFDQINYSFSVFHNQVTTKIIFRKLWYFIVCS